MKKLNKLFAILIAVLGVQTLSAQTDVTNQYLTNAGFESVNGWTIAVDKVGESYGGTYYKLDTGTDPNTIEVYHTWAGSSSQLAQTKNFKFSQKVTLPAGEYRLRVNGFYREGNQKNATTEKAWAFAGENKQNLVGIGNCGANNMSDAANVFKNGGCLNEFDFTITEEKQIEIGFQGYINTSLSWVILGPVSLLQYSMDDFNAELNAARTKLQNVTGLNTAMRNKVSAMLAETANVTQTKVAILEATAKVNNLYNEAMEMQTAIAEANAAISACESMLTNSTADDKTAFSEAISTAKTMLDGAADIATVKSVLSPLNEAKNAYCLVAAPAEGYPFDMTHLVVNPKFDEGTTGWTHNTGAPNWGIATNQGGEITGNYFENWKWESYTGEIYQELTGLPKGKYRLTAAAFRDQLIDGATDGDAVYVFANDVETLVNSATPVFYSVEVATTTGTLRFGVRSKVAKYRWMGIDNVSLQFIEALDLSEFIAAYNIALEAAKAARDNAEYSNITGVEKTALLNAIANVPAETQESLSEATAALQSITAAFIAAKGDYDKLANEITIARNLGMTDDAINTVTAGKTGAAAYPDLKVAEYTYIYNTYTEDAPIGNWTSQFDQIDGQSYDGTNVKYFDKWGDGTFALKQTVTLPKGDYAISVIARGQSGANGTLYYKIGEETTSTPLIMKNDTGFGVDINGVANFSSTGTYSNNNNGRGWEYRFITFHLDAETSVEIGVTATVNWQWASVYAPQLLTDPSSKKALLLSEITNLLSNVPSGLMNAEVENTLNTAKTVAQSASNENTIAELNTIYADFKNAIDNANASIAEYNAIATYIAKADGIHESIASDYKTQHANGTISESLETVFQNLEVATYNYVMNNFTYPVALSDTWNSNGTNTQAATFSNEHWSGTTREYKNQDDNNGQGWNAQAWSIDFDQSVTLPAGDYVFKVAGRKSAGTTLELVVTMGETTLGTVNDFPSSNNARGINKAGAASFDPEDPAEFANNGNGFGWQWRYVKFTLDAEATVKVAVHAEANSHGQWVSFGDYTLQMTEETYLEANKGGLDAPTAAAEALVDTKPMGTAENNALKAALAMTYTTGAQLLAKIEALETAVANANTWVTAYNDAKAPLVAALDRFEADYNDAENGALDYMNKERWATAISKAQAAAEAKDVTDSYDGFEAATEELVAALDAAQVSVDEYAALKSAIDKANTLANGGNWGDQPFQRPTSAKESLNTTTAQATYDAAEADGEAVTSVTDALNENVKTVDAIVLNAPAEGTKYNMVMDYAGWEHHGKAVTYLAGGRNDAGLYNIQYYAAPNANYAQAFTFTAVEGKANCYTLSMTDVDGNERYVCTGVVYGGNTGQIRTTTDAAQALAVKVIATTTDGIHHLYNTEANNYIGGQDAGFYTVNSHTTFRLQEAAKANVTLTLSEVGWATLILPFDAELPEGVKAYSCTEADGEILTLTEAESLKANTPYLMNGEKSTHVFTGYGLADKDSYTDGLFTGTYVDYQTTADGKTYVLQNQDGNLAFYLVTDAQPWIRAYRSYMVYEGAAGAPKFSLGRGEGTTSIDKAQLTIDNVVIYDLMGRKVSTMEKGGVYIVNGKKVVIK